MRPLYLRYFPPEILVVFTILTIIALPVFALLITIRSLYNKVAYQRRRYEVEKEREGKKVSPQGLHLQRAQKAQPGLPDRHGQ